MRFENRGRLWRHKGAMRRTHCRECTCMICHRSFITVCFWRRRIQRDKSGRGMWPTCLRIREVCISNTVLSIGSHRIYWRPQCQSGEAYARRTASTIGDSRMWFSCRSLRLWAITNIRKAQAAPRSWKDLETRTESCKSCKRSLWSFCAGSRCGKLREELIMLLWFIIRIVCKWCGISCGMPCTWWRILDGMRRRSRALGKDIVAPYKHIVSNFPDDSTSFENRKTLLFFQGAIKRKEVSLKT